MLLVLCTREDYTLRTRNSRHTHRFISTHCRRMCSLDEIPLKVALDCVEISLSEKDPVGDPEMKVPDCTQILHDTKYSFTLEKRIMAACEELQRKNRRAKKLPQSVCPTCPPYWLMFSSPQQSRVGRSGSRESWELGPRPRSSSLNAADSNRLRPLRVAQFLISDSDFEGGYSEDDEGSSTEEDASRSKKRPQSSGPQSKAHIQRVSTPQVTRPGSSSTRPSSASALKETQKPLPQTPDGIPHTSRAPRRKPAPMRTSGRRSSHTQLQQRPSSAGPLPSTRQQKPTSHGVRPRTSAGLQDASADLLCALSEEERDLLEAVTKQGYTLHTAIMALQRTGPKSPDQILSYLTSCDRLCRLGYEKTQVEEALEMFPNCESKAAEFLFLLAQFCEMGFQQSTIKEVLLVHENHKERALEELISRKY